MGEGRVPPVPEHEAGADWRSGLAGDGLVEARYMFRLLNWLMLVSTRTDVEIAQGSVEWDSEGSEG